MALVRDDVVFPRDSGDRAAMWRRHLQPVFDISFAAHARFDQPMHLTTYNTAEMLIGTSAGPAQRLVRDRRKVAQQGLDHLFFQIYRSGDGTIAGERTPERPVSRANLLTFDFARPVTIECAAVAAINVVVPRALMAERFASFDHLHAAVIDLDANPLGHLLADHLAAVIGALPAATAQQLPDLTRATASLIAALLPRAESDGRERARHLKLAIRQHVDANLQSRDMSVGAVAERFGCSRSKLQRLFEPEGGFARHVTARRLAHAYRHLARRNRASRLDIGQLAYHVGFKDVSGFSTAFKRLYGIAPRQVASGRSDMAMVSNKSDLLRDWIQTLA